MSELTVEPRQGGGYVVIWPNGDKAEWPLSSEAFRYTIADRRRRLRELEAIEEYEKRQLEIPVGTAGTATVRGVKGVRVMWCRDLEEITGFWWSAQFIGSQRVHQSEHVTDFKPDEPLADWEHELLDKEREKKIRAEERKRITYRFHVAFLNDVDPETVDPRTVHAWLLSGAR